MYSATHVASGELEQLTSCFFVLIVVDKKRLRHRPKRQQKQDAGDARAALPTSDEPANGVKVFFSDVRPT